MALTEFGGNPRRADLKDLAEKLSLHLGSKVRQTLGTHKTATSTLAANLSTLNIKYYLNLISSIARLTLVPYTISLPCSVFHPSSFTSISCYGSLAQSFCSYTEPHAMSD